MSDEITVAGVAIGLVGGIGGTVLAEYSRLRRKPKLSLEPVQELAPAVIAGKKAVYVRLDVANAQRRDGASGVSVRIDRIHSQPQNDGGNAEALTFLQGWQLAWANDDRGDPNVPPSPKPVPSGDRRTIDLAHLNMVAPGQLIVDIRPQPERGNHLNRLRAGRFTFELAVSGDNASTRRYAVDLIHDGARWGGEQDAAAERVRVERIRSL